MIPFEEHLIELKLYNLKKTTFDIENFVTSSVPLSLSIPLSFCCLCKKKFAFLTGKKGKFRMRDDCDLWQIDSDSDLCWLEKISQPLTVFSSYFSRA